MISKVFKFLNEVADELKKVTWPTRQEAIKMTFTVIAVSVVVAVFIGSLDFVLTQFISKILTR
ncbi:MAG: preprotein translocase subunit SecE [Candidatus Woykebacteria bacterium RBG_13_40_15]|uniref:Protein translocase subunit SecE n=1 Tax=Candidatus Woykebacteria bacterium RBG_13_40_15 TaxID=1802593 RepID=A0A1G1W6E0_9BACT|nr:MAG: preprotein translocase subunit SecE [Candidatus Woykebacteria bacterium RBG_13_40_15]